MHARDQAPALRRAIVRKQRISFPKDINDIFSFAVITFNFTLLSVRSITVRFITAIKQRRSKIILVPLEH